MTGNHDENQMPAGTCVAHVQTRRERGRPQRPVYVVRDGAGHHGVSLA